MRVLNQADSEATDQALLRTAEESELQQAIAMSTTGTAHNLFAVLKFFMTCMPR